MMIFFMSLFIQAEYFGEKIEYFKDSSQKPVESKINQQRKENKFDWNKYLDEKNDEFFKEGDYTPPAPFLEAMRRPTKQNILLFEKWHEKKNFLLKRFNDKRAEILGKPVLKEEKTNYNEVLPILKEFTFVFYFDSMCSSCRGMFEVVNELTRLGVFIETVRVDSLETEVQGLSIPWVRANKKEIEQLKLTAVPMLLAFQKSSKKAFKIVGKKSVFEISEILNFKK